MSFSQPVTDRRPSMTLFSGPLDIYSHCCRVVLLEKDIECTIEHITAKSDSVQISEHNPYGETPTLLDRDVSLYGMNVILEYLDERFPHPPLMPVDPIIRAKTRLMVSRLSRDWFKPLSKFCDSPSPKLPPVLKKSIHDGLTALSPIFANQAYFLGDEFAMVDAYLGPLLWRLDSFDIQLPKQAEEIVAYGERLFSRSAFYDSLSKLESELRP